MPFLDAPDDVARPPRLPAPAASAWPGPLDVDDGYAEVRGAEVSGPLGLSMVDELALLDSRLVGVSFVESDRLRLETSGCEFVDCDLSRVTVASADRSRFVGCKFAGTDFSDARMDDLAFERGLFRYTNLRLARLNRVAFSDCSFDDVDLYEARLADVSFAGTELRAVGLDKTRFERTDFRRATTLDPTSVAGLQGALISEAQVLELATVLALRAGVTIDRPE